MRTLIGRLLEVEAALVIGVITASAALITAAGIAIITEEQIAALVGFAVALLALGQALVTRSQVWAEATVHEAIAEHLEDDSDRDEAHG